MKQVLLTEEQFDEKYTTVENHLEPNASFSGCMFETYDDEVRYVFDLAKKERRVWTIVTTDDDGMSYLSGFHLVNRMGYLVTEEEYPKDVEIEVELDVD